MNQAIPITAQEVIDASDRSIEHYLMCSAEIIANSIQKHNSLLKRMDVSGLIWLNPWPLNELGYYGC